MPDGSTVKETEDMSPMTFPIFGKMTALYLPGVVGVPEIVAVVPLREETLIPGGRPVAPHVTDCARRAGVEQIVRTARSGVMEAWSFILEIRHPK